MALHLKVGPEKHLALRFLRPAVLPVAHWHPGLYQAPDPHSRPGPVDPLYRLARRVLYVGRPYCLHHRR